MDSFFDESDSKADEYFKQSYNTVTIIKASPQFTGALSLKSKSGTLVQIQFELRGKYLSFWDEQTGKIRKTIDISWKRLQPFEELSWAGNILFGFIIRGWNTVETFYWTCQDDLERWLDVLIPRMILLDVQEDFEFGDCCGYGQSAQVYVCLSYDNNKEYAIKTIFKQTISKEELETEIIREIEIMRQIDHESCVHLHRVYEDESAIHLVMDYAPGSTLYDHMLKYEKFTEAQTQSVICQLLQVLDYIHSKSIIHRDLKLENILMKWPTDCQDILLADFGLSEIGDIFTQKCGTAGYVAPELHHSATYTQKADVYSVGILMYILLSGVFPFPGTDSLEILRNNMKSEIYFSYKHWNTISVQAMSFIQKLTSKDPTQRPSALEALKDDWFTSKPEIVTNQEFEDSAYMSTNILNISPVDLGELSPTSLDLNWGDESPQFKSIDLSPIRDITSPGERIGIYNIRI